MEMLLNGGTHPEIEAILLTEVEILGKMNDV